MNHTILLVEDDPSDSILIKRAFDKAELNATLVRAKDGDDAVAYLDGTGPYQNREEYPLPSLVLLDIKLPRRSGFEVLSWIRRDPRPLRRLPVVMLTSSRHSVDINRAYELGANAYTVKPDTNAELTELLRCVKDFWLGKNEYPITCATPADGSTTGLNGAKAQERTILLVEDERSDAMLITRALNRAGYNGAIEHALDATVALSWLHRQSEGPTLPSLVLLDLKLPGMSGFELMDEIRRTPNLRQVPIVVLAGSKDADTINRAYERGANSYLVKSPDPDEVNRLMTFLQQYWLNVNQHATRHRPSPRGMDA
ncbi:MAG TPA: response regulator [Terracidiphilus sp.]|jgi:CheY-like chemotaxis protein